MKIDHPELLTQDEFYKAYADFLYLQDFDRTFYLNIYKEALTDLFKVFFPTTK